MVEIALNIKHGFEPSAELLTVSRRNPHFLQGFGKPFGNGPLRHPYFLCGVFRIRHHQVGVAGPILFALFIAMGRFSAYGAFNQATVKEIFATVLEGLFIPAKAHFLARLPRCHIHQPLIGVIVEFTLYPKLAIVKWVLDQEMKHGPRKRFITFGAIPQAIGELRQLRQGIEAGSVFMEKPLDDRRAVRIRYHSVFIGDLIHHIQIPRRRWPDGLAVAGLVFQAPLYVFRELEHVAFGAHRAESPHHNIVGRCMLAYHHALAVEMQLNLFLADHLIEQTDFLKAPLHPIHCIGYDGDSFLMAAGIIQHRHKLLAIATGGGFHKLVFLDYREASTLAVFLQALQLRR